MNTNFTELSTNEMVDIEGGKLYWFDIPLSMISPGYATARIGYELFMLGYRNGYDSTRG